MIILGVDPGTLFTGYGVINAYGNLLKYLTSGVINLNSNLTLPQKLDKIYKHLSQIMLQYKVEHLSIETSFFGKNFQSAMKIGYAKGAALLAAEHTNLDCTEFTPREIKKAVTGRGGSSKEQVSFMIKTLLNISVENLKFDETDGLAAAICYAFNCNGLSETKSKGWADFVKNNPNRVIE